MDPSRVVLVRISGEITIKSPGIVRLWIRTLLKNIRRRLFRKQIHVGSIAYRAGRIYVETDNADGAAAEISRVFGVKEAIVAWRVDRDIESIIECATNIAKGWTGTFAVRASRVGDYPLKSIEINSILGEKILETNKNLSVDLSNPDHVLEVEVREDYAYVYETKFAGYGGLPYGVSGKGIVLMSGGIDSSLAAWLMMRRGMRIVVLHIDLSPYYSQDARRRFDEAVFWLKEWTPNGRLKVYVVPIGHIHDRVRLPSNRYRCVFCKMLMLRIAERIAMLEKAHAIITGEVLSQVASQTPQNILAIDRCVRIPVLRPLIHMDKDDIDRLAQRIGLYNIVARDVGECSLVPKRPAIETDEETAEILCGVITESMVRDAIAQGLEEYL